MAEQSVLVQVQLLAEQKDAITSENTELKAQLKTAQATLKEKEKLLRVKTAQWDHYVKLFQTSDEQLTLSEQSVKQLVTQLRELTLELVISRAGQEHKEEAE